MTAHDTPPRLFTLIALTALPVLSMNMISPTLPTMAASFGVDYGVMSVAISGYLLVTGLVMLIGGALADRYGRRTVAVAALGGFVVAAIGAALASSIEAFLAWRLAQGVVLAGWVAALSSIRDTSAPGEAASRIAYVSSAMAVAPMLGPMAGGALEAAFGWRAPLHALWICGALVLALVWFDFGETRRDAASAMRDVFTGYLALVRTPVFWASALCIAFSTAFFHIFVTGAPFVSASALDLSPDRIGMWMAATPIGFLVGALISGRIAGRISAAGMMISGRLIACGGLGFGLLLVMGGQITPLVIFGAAVFGGLGNGITIPSANAHVMAVAGPAAGSAAGLSGALGVVMGALLAQFTGVALTASNGPWALMAIAVSCAFAGLVAALFARHRDAARLL